MMTMIPGGDWNFSTVCTFMDPPSYIQFVIDQNIVMWCMTYFTRSNLLRFFQHLMNMGKGKSPILWPVTILYYTRGWSSPLTALGKFTATWHKLWIKSLRLCNVSLPDQLDHCITKDSTTFPFTNAPCFPLTKN
jgi:hypothetical protein